MTKLSYLTKSIEEMIPIRSADKNLPLYYLAFFSKHEQGYKFWRPEILGRSAGLGARVIRVVRGRFNGGTGESGTLMRASLLLMLFIGASRALGQVPHGVVDTATFRSQSLGTTKRYLVYLPPSYERATSRRFPVAYYLHGLWGDETNWTALGRLDHTVDSLIARGMPELIVVMPDGDDSWYTTWNVLGDYQGCLKQRAADYCVPWPHYDDYIARDLVAHVDSTYRTLADRRYRGIAGLSMGGYGAVWFALAYADVFGAAASHSGVLAPLLVAYDSTTLRTRYAAEIAQAKPQFPSMLLAFGRDTAGWWARDPGRRAISLARSGSRAASPALYIDVGVADPFLNQSRAFRDVLLGVQLRPEYYERDGAHDWAYWRANAVHSVTFLARRLMAQ